MGFSVAFKRHDITTISLSKVFEFFISPDPLNHKKNSQEFDKDWSYCFVGGRVGRIYYLTILTRLSQLFALFGFIFFGKVFGIEEERF